MYIKGEVLSITKAYPYKQIAQEIGRLHLWQFMVLHEIASEKQGERQVVDNSNM